MRPPEPIRAIGRVLALLIALLPGWPGVAATQPPQQQGPLTWVPSPVARPPGAFGIYTNPAGLAYSPGTEIDLIWSSLPGMADQDRSVLVKLGALGLGFDHLYRLGEAGTDFTLAGAWQITPQFAAGYSHRWVKGGTNVWNVGVLRRFAPWLTSGLLVADLNQPDGRDLRATAGLTLELFRNRLLLSGEATLFTDPGAGLAYGDRYDPLVHLTAQAARGVLLRGTLGRDYNYLGLELNLGTGLGLGGLQRNTQPSGASAGRVTWLRLGRSEFESLAPAPPRRWVQIDMTSLPPEQPTMLFGIIPLQQETLLDLLLDLRTLARDPRVEGVVLKLGGVRGGWATLQEVREALLALREAGKQLMVWSETLFMGDLFLASAADSLFVPESGSVQLTGLAAEMTYFGAMLEKIGVRAEFVRIADYKSAPESFTRTGPSPESLAMTNWLLDSYWEQFLEALAAGRGVDRAQAEAWVDRGPLTAPEALAAGLIDGLAYGDQVLAHKGRMRGGRRVESLSAYRRSRPPAVAFMPIPLPRIAVIYATGAIVSGKSGNDLFQGSLLGAETVAAAIREARENSQVRGIVLRVSSPGGSALASDLIWREVKRTAGSGKPIVVSMGDVAASGGYYISCAADYVLARPGSVTGSIGIFGGKFDLSGLYDTIGYDVVRVERGQYAGALSPHRGLTDQERERLYELLQQGYDLFLDRVAEGRGLSPAEVDGIGQGRVWTGEQALAHGLVDGLGGLLDAIEEARRRAGLGNREIELMRYPRPDFRFDLFSAGRLVQGAWPMFAPSARDLLPEPLRRVDLQREWLERLAADSRFYLMEGNLVITP